MERKFMILSFVAFLTIVLWISTLRAPTQSEDHSLLLRINRSIDNAIDFLYTNQLDYGEFKTYACALDNMSDCYFDSSPFATTFVLYSIKDIRDERVEIMTNKALEFLLSEQQPGGLWSVYTSRNTKKIVPDFDDTAAISAVLLLLNQSFDDNIDIFNKNRDDSGMVYLWLNDGLTFPNEIDCEVNANVLFYFGVRGIEDQEICDIINDEILNERYDCCIYCENREFGKNPLPLFYVISRAYKHSNSCLTRSKDHIINKTLEIQLDNEAFKNELDTAYIVNILLNLDYHGNEIDSGIQNLIEKQHPDGSWGMHIFYLGPAPYYGSKEVTTALAVEALHKYTLKKAR